MKKGGGTARAPQPADEIIPCTCAAAAAAAAAARQVGILGRCSPSKTRCVRYIPIPIPALVAAAGASPRCKVDDRGDALL